MSDRGENCDRSLRRIFILLEFQELIDTAAAAPNRKSVAT
jgi:hypothetical protein